LVDEIKKKILKNNLEITRPISKLVSISQIVEPKKKISVVKDDPDDNKIIECAIEAKADYIISQDKHLLKLKSYKNIKIITPDDFLSKFFN